MAEVLGDSSGEIGMGVELGLVLVWAGFGVGIGLELVVRLDEGLIDSASWWCSGLMSSNGWGGVSPGSEFELLFSGFVIVAVRIAELLLGVW